MADHVRVGAAKISEQISAAMVEALVRVPGSLRTRVVLDAPAFRAFRDELDALGYLSSPSRPPFSLNVAPGPALTEEVFRFADAWVMRCDSAPRCWLEVLAPGTDEMPERPRLIIEMEGLHP
jgi:hypothetical protein